MSSQRESLTSSFNDFSSLLLLLEVEHLTYRTSTINEPETFLEIEGGFGGKRVFAPMYLQPHYGNGGFGNVYLLTLDNTKRCPIAIMEVVDTLGL